VNSSSSLFDVPQLTLEFFDSKAIDHGYKIALTRPDMRGAIFSSVSEFTRNETKSLAYLMLCHTIKIRNAELPLCSGVNNDLNLQKCRERDLHVQIRTSAINSSSMTEFENAVKSLAARSKITLILALLSMTGCLIHFPYRSYPRMVTIRHFASVSCINLGSLRLMRRMFLCDRFSCSWSIGW